MGNYWDKPHKEITKRLDRPRTVFYSVDADMNDIAVEGEVMFYMVADWGDGDNYYSLPMTNPTWLDVALAADDMINTVKDFHHVFLEGICPANPERVEKTMSREGIPIYTFVMGS